MSGHRPKPRQVPTVAPAIAASGDPAQPAHQALAASRFKEAVEAFKTLLKRERRPEWLAGLAAAYAGRAEQLAAKDMLKEALALWRTRAQICGVALLDGPYLRWLLRSGDVLQALQLLYPASAAGKGVVAGPTPALTPAQLSLLEQHLAGAVLVAPEAMLAVLPAESALRLHRAPALAALAEACANDGPALGQALEQIAFRSPYRDLRPLLKALALLRVDRAQAAEALARVPPDGAFERLAAVLRVALLTGDEWLSGLGRLDPPGRQLLLDLEGCPEGQRPVLLALANNPQTTPAALHELLLRQQRALPAGLARSFCRRLLVHDVRCHTSHVNAFGGLPPGEVEHRVALMAELSGDFEAAAEYWDDYAKLPIRSAAQDLRAALVLRRLASDKRFDNDEPGQVIAWLRRSLDFEPGHLASELQLLRELRSAGELKELRQRLDKALPRFANDAALRLEAVHAALSSGAFKKAIGLAKEVLALDPIHPQARGLIGQAHLSQARKQIAAGKPTAAEPELDQAQSWLRTADDLATLGLLRGIAALPGERGARLLQQGLASFAVPLLGSFELALQACQVRRDPAIVLSLAGHDGRRTPGNAELVALAKRLNALAASDVAPRPALASLAPMLTRAVGQPGMAQTDLVLLCEAFERHGQNDLLTRSAKAALKQWPKHPMFIAFEVAARHGSALWNMPVRDFERIDQAMDAAAASGDRQALSRLRRMLDKAYLGPPQRRSGRAGAAARLEVHDWPEDSDFEPALAEVLSALLSTAGPKAVLQIARQKMGKAAFDQARREIGGDDASFARALLTQLDDDDDDLDIGFNPFSGPIKIVPSRPAKPIAQARQQPASAPHPDQKSLFDD